MSPVYKTYLKELRMSKGKNQHIVPHPDGWAVKSEGASKATQVFSTQQEAINRGRDIAKNQQSELFIHDREGEIRERNSYCRTASEESPTSPSDVSSSSDNELPGWIMIVIIFIIMIAVSKQPSPQQTPQVQPSSPPSSQYRPLSP